MQGDSVARTRILIVDDEPDFRDMLAFFFDRKGFEVFTAENGRKAFEWIERNAVDVVLSDIRMPGGDGIELLDRIRDRCPDTPVVLLVTGFAEISTEEAHNRGAEALFGKPFDRQILLETIERLRTDGEVRWSEPSAEVKCDWTVELEVQGIGEAIESRMVSLGRGGMFVCCAGAKIPNVNDAVSFRLIFKKGNENWDGCGIVKWVRTKDEVDLRAGCGIEFTYLCDGARKRIVELLDASRPKAFIPNR